MADTAFQIQYRQEFIAGFEFNRSQLSACVVNEAMIKGNQATFLVADSGGASAVTRGVNGLIPARPDNLNQYTATLVEWHDLVRKTGFNVFASQGDQNRIMQQTTMAVINRKMDLDIISELDTATQNSGAAAVASLTLVAKAQTKLGNNFIPVDEADNMFGLATPAFMGYLMQLKEFGSSDWVDIKPFAGPTRKMLRWYGINWIISPLLTGTGTASEKCYVFHRNSIGHAVDKAGLKSPVGYDDEQDYSWARASIFMGSKKLQNTGIYQMVHDGSALS